ncbi:MAG: SHOCT domain-containing protein [Nanobdellota archaeon]
MGKIFYLLVAVLSVQSAWANDWGHMMYPGAGHMFWNFGFIGLFFMVLFWGGIIFLIYWLVKKATEAQQPSQKPSKKPSKKPLDILEERYAKGEITKSESEKRKKELEK